MQKLKSLSISPLNGKAKSLVIILHGYGDSGQGILGLGHEWAASLPDTAFVAPNAPEVCEAFASGFQWFSLRASEGINTGAFEKGDVAQKPADILSAFIDEQLDHWGLTDDRLAVVGFSQGAMMAMYLMPRRAKPCAAVIGYSGLLCGAAGLLEPKTVKMPVLAVHGGMDDVVVPGCLDAIDSGFSAAGFDVETVLRPNLGHSIDEFGLMRGLDFLKEHLEKNQK